jgi:TonB family protein
MKTILIIVLLLFSKSLYAIENQFLDTPSNVFSDEPLKTKEIDSILNLFDEKEPENVGCCDEQSPEFAGGDEALLKFIRDSTTYPKDAKRKKIQGKVLIRFVVNTDGSLKDFCVAKKLYPSCDEEALRVARLLPKFRRAASISGKPIAVWYVVPFDFNLEKEKELKK